MLEFKAVFARYNVPRLSRRDLGKMSNVFDFITSNSSALFAADSKAIEFSMFMRVIESILPSKLPFTLLYYVVARTNRLYSDPTLCLNGTFHIQRGKKYIAPFDFRLRFPRKRCL